MVTTTTNLSLNKPAVNSAVDEDLWGGQWNDNADTLDSEAATATLNKDFGDFQVSRANVKDLSEVAHDLGNVSGALAIDYTNGHYQYGTVTGNITSVTINNLPASGRIGFLTLELTQNGTGGYTVDLATGSTYRQPGGGSINYTTTASAVSKLRFETRDAGTTIDVTINDNYGDIT